MTKRWTALATALIVCLAIPVFAQTDEPEMDPLLELLVEQGVITAEQAALIAEQIANGAGMIGKSGGRGGLRGFDGGPQGNSTGFAPFRNAPTSGA